MNQKNIFNTVRIEELAPYEIDCGVTTDTVWFENHNIQDCIEATEKLGIEPIHLQTRNIAFLKDPRLQNVKGISIQSEIQNIKPLFLFKHLTHLSLPENIKIEFDFSNFKELIFLGGTLPKNYINFNQLAKLQVTYLWGYRKANFNEFINCKDLKTLQVFSTDVENLKGLSDLSKLSHISLNNCRKLISLEGIGSQNINLRAIGLTNCKKLRTLDNLISIPDLETLVLYQIPQLNSLSFLNNLNKLENIMIHPKKVGVLNDDYYPLIEALKRINKLDYLRDWKLLDDYLNNKVVIETKIKNDKSDLDLIKDALDIMSWTEKKKDGLEQYTKRNCKKAESILLDCINQLEKVKQDEYKIKEDLIKQCILKLNDFNAKLGGGFIETGEREELCDLFDNIADAVGLDIQDYQDGIASRWRTW